MTAAIDVADLGYAYPDGTRALESVTFDTGPGTIVGLLGENGAGKTTLIEILAGLRLPTSGSAAIAGHPAGSLEARAALGYLPHGSPAYPEMTVSEYLRYSARLRGCDALPAKLAERLGLGDLAGRPIGALSRGLRQRVGLAAALAPAPAVLLLDEPTTGLDPNQLAEVRGLVRDAARDALVLLSTHVLSEAAQLCDWLVVLAGGRVAAVGAPDAIVGPDGEGLEDAFARLAKGPASA